MAEEEAALTTEEPTLLTTTSREKNKEKEKEKEEKEEEEKNQALLAKGISSLYGPAIKHFDAQVDGALKSQSVLASSLDRLTTELDKLLEAAPLPFAAQHVAGKLSDVRKRVQSLNSTLNIIQKRIDSIDRMLTGHAFKVEIQGRHESNSNVEQRQINLNSNSDVN